MPDMTVADTPILSLKERTIVVDSSLTIDTLSAALRWLKGISHPIETVSFKNSGHLDSGAVVFLLQCQKKAGSQRLSLKNVPPRLLGLLDLYGLGHFFSQV